MLHGYQDDLSIERQNVNGNYSPDNCYWATNSTQASNKRKRLGKTSQYIGVAPNKASGKPMRAFMESVWSLELTQQTSKLPKFEMLTSKNRAGLTNSISRS